MASSNLSTRSTITPATSAPSLRTPKRLTEYLPRSSSEHASSDRSDAASSPSVGPDLAASDGEDAASSSGGAAGGATRSKTPSPSPVPSDQVEGSVTRRGTVRTARTTSTSAISAKSKRPATAPKKNRRKKGASPPLSTQTREANFIVVIYDDATPSVKCLYNAAPISPSLLLAPLAITRASSVTLGKYSAFSYSIEDEDESSRPGGVVSVRVMGRKTQHEEKRLPARGTLSLVIKEGQATWKVRE